MAECFPETVVLYWNFKKLAHYDDGLDDENFIQSKTVVKAN